jgi:23S rRNA (uracil1939-C5)-methyltransferase
VGRAEGKVFFVPWTAPGDVLTAKVTLSKKNYGEAEMVELLRPSPHRVKPLCPVFGICGGCRFQHISYEEQLRQKDLYVQKALRFLPEGVLESIRPCPRPFHYRNRIQLQVRAHEFGFLKMKSNEVVPIDGCPLAEEPIDRFLGTAEALGALKKTGASKVEVSLSEKGRLMVAAVGATTEESRFSQVNRFQNDFLIETVLEWAAPLLRESSAASPLLDLYAGAGNFTFPLHEKFGRPVVAVELSRPSVQKALQKASAFPKMRFIQNDVGDFLNSAEAKSFAETDLVLTDPPREGLSHEVLSGLERLSPRALIHIGCHLMNFARDLQRLKELGYEIKKVRPLDMFPQTDHVELVALVVRP